MQVKFTDVTAEVAPDLKNIGMVCDALFTDFDNDGQTDLLLAGEWMPVTFLKNVDGKFRNVSSNSGINDKTDGGIQSLQVTFGILAEPIILSEMLV